MHPRGTGYALIAALMFGLGVVLAKLLSGEMDAVIVAFLSLSFGGILLAIYLLLTGKSPFHSLSALNRADWINIFLLCGFTFGCNSVRHLVGGQLNCFSCPNNISQTRSGYRAWRLVTRFNEQHMLWAWLSLFSVGFADLYIRLCAMGVWKDPRLI